PLFATQFQVPGNRSIDARLATGAILFGAGWGLVGLCPGPAISALSFGGPPIFIFMASMAAGMGLFELFNQISKERTAA
ncbi:MAG TPA: transporter, partial [Hyphomonas sp.]|nr:transporter [Hyphomonas sp.]